MTKIMVKDTEVTVLRINNEDFISLTDIARFKTSDTNAVIGNWMRNRNTIEYLGIWESYIILILNPSNSRGLKKNQV